MSKLLNPTQGPGITFGATVSPGVNVSGRIACYGQIVIPDFTKTDADSTSVTSGIAGSAWANFRDQLELAAANVRRAPHQIVGIMVTKQSGGVPDNGPIDVLLEGYLQAWVRRTVANAAPAIYDAIGSPVGVENPGTQITRVLSSGLNVVLAAGTPGPQKTVGLCETLITSTATAVDVAEGAGPFPVLPTGPSGTLYVPALYGTANGIMLADVLFEGVRGF